MNYRQMLVLAAGSILAAVIMPMTFLEIGSHQLTAAEFFNNQSPYGLIVKFGNSGNGNSWFDGLYARPGVSPFEGIVGGVLFPLVALVVGICLLAGIGRNSNPPMTLRPNDPSNTDSTKGISWSERLSVVTGLLKHWERGAIIALCIVGAFVLTFLFWFPLALIWTSIEFLLVAPQGRQNYMNYEIVPIGGLIVMFGLFPIALSIVFVRARSLLGLPPTPPSSKQDH